jgi:hypothetical protein
MSQISPFGDLGPCEIEWDDRTITAIHEDGAVFRLVMSTADIKEGAYGTSVVDMVGTGYEQCEVEVPFTRITFGNLQRLVPGSSLSGNNSLTASGGVIGHAGTMVGTPLYDLSHELIVKRIVNGVAEADGTNWLHIFKTFPIPRFDIPFNVAGQRGFIVLFKAFPLQVASSAADPIGATWRIGGTK